MPHLVAARTSLRIELLPHKSHPGPLHEVSTSTLQSTRCLSIRLNTVAITTLLAQYSWLNTASLTQLRGTAARRRGDVAHHR